MSQPEWATTTVLPGVGLAPAPTRRRWLPWTIAAVGTVVIALVALVVTSTMGAIRDSRGAVSAYLEAVRAGDFAAAHNQLCDPMRAQLSATELRDELTKVTKAEGPLEAFSIDDVTVNRSFAIGTGPSGSTALASYTLEFAHQTEHHQAVLTRTGDGWRLCGFR